MMNEPKPPLIAHIIYALDTGGLENGLVNIINRSPEGRYRHAIICLTTARDFSQRITVPNVRIVELHKSPGHDFGMYWRLWKVLREMQPAIVHSRNLAALETQFVGLFVPGLKRVHGEHGRDISDLDGSNWKYQLLRKMIRVFINAYVAVSKDLEKWLACSVKVPQHRIHQIYNGVDQSRFKPREIQDLKILPPDFCPDGEAVIFGTVGRLAAVKDQKTLLLAFHDFLKKHQEIGDKFRLLIVGGGPLADELSALLIELGIVNQVWMTGDRDDIPSLLQAMDVFVLPSLAEGVSNTVLEAMASGLPVIATNVGGNPELIESDFNGLLVPVSDVAAMSSAMAALACSAEIRAVMGARALNLVKERYNWDKTVGAYMDLYDSLLGRDSASFNEAITE